MAGKKRRELAPALVRAQDRFRVWRRSRKPGDVVFAEVERGGVPRQQ